MSKLGGVTETGTVISNLPLLFADGLPTSLEVITEKQIEKFILLMLNCASGREYFCRDNMTTPIWWPDAIPFSIPVTKPPQVEESQWLPNLKSLVKQCYAYHGCQFMLKFCTDLAKYPTELLKFVDLCDGTTSLHNKNTGKLLVTFRNQNLIYDRKEACSPRKYLLPRGGKGSEGTTRPHLMVQPTFIDIYLCDSCDAEFETLSEVREHEHLCQQEQCDQPPRSLRSSSPDDLQDIDQSKFLNYFDIRERVDVENFPQKSPPRPVPFKRKCQGGASFIRCTTVSISSPLGLSLQKKMPRAMYIVPQTHIDRLERYCLPLKQNSRITWSHLYKTEQKNNSTDWVHTYSFNKRQRLAKYEALETGLSLRSRCLLNKCPRLEVAVTRLTQEEIIHYKNGVSKRLPVTSKPTVSPILKDVKPIVSHTHAGIPVIDLCSSEDEEDTRVISSIRPPTSKAAKITNIGNVVHTEDSSSSKLIKKHCETIASALPSKYLSRSLPNNITKIKKSIIVHKRSKRARKSLACENETFSVKQAKKKKKICDSSLHNVAKTKLQELNKIKESKDWYLQFISSSQANHDGKKYATVV